MGAERDAMRDVEIVDGGDLTLDPADPREPEPDRDASVRRRRARALRLLRRWWPVPLALVLALVAVQVVQDTRLREVVEQRRTVDGVLHRAVDADLVPRAEDDRGLLWLQYTDIRTADGRIGFAEPASGSDSLLRAVDADGAVTWTHEFGGTGTPTGAGVPSCSGDGDPATRVLCVVLEQKSVEQEDGYWTLAPPSAASLVTLDAQTGAVLGTEDLPPRTGGTAENGVLYLASLAEDATTLTVTASDALTGAQRWTGTLPVDGGDWSQSDLALRAPSVRVDRGHLVVDSIPVTWVIDPSDGTVEMTGSIGMGISRTGLVVESSSATQMFDLDGTVLLSEAAAPAGLAVDDGSVPDLEILVSQSQSTARTLTAVDPRTGRTAWTLERTGWQDAGMILLDDVLYGTTTRSAWAVDATTGRELWSAEALTASGTQAVTDGENLLVTTWGPADGPDGTVENRYLLTALRLSDGATLWSTALPDGLQAVWSVGGDLVGFTEDGGLRVLD